MANFVPKGSYLTHFQTNLQSDFNTPAFFSVVFLPDVLVRMLSWEWPGWIPDRWTFNYQFKKTPFIVHSDAVGINVFLIPRLGFYRQLTFLHYFVLEGMIDELYSILFVKIVSKSDTKTKLFRILNSIRDRKPLTCITLGKTWLTLFSPKCYPAVLPCTPIYVYIKLEIEFS